MPESAISNSVDIAVIGAGPYGLSVAAHLSHLGVDFRVFGRSMETWHKHMPVGMHLKSDGFASNLSAPANESSLCAYCRRHAIPYHDVAVPVPLAAFIDYGLDFQHRFVPDLDERSVASLQARNDGFELRLGDGETIKARRVILAVGITHFDYTPPILAGLPAEMVSHSSAHHNLNPFRNCDIAVVGAGASAVDLSALLHDAGAKVQLVARTSAIRFGSKPEPGGRSLWQSIRHPQSGLGPGLRSRLACDLPDLFRYLPSPLRLEIVRRHLGPASAWHVKPRVVGQISIRTGHKVIGAEIRNDRVRLSLQPIEGRPVAIEVDHVIAATGYRSDIDRLHFIDEHLRSCIRRVGQMPELSPNFKSTVHGLFCVGNAAAGSFGPLMRFVYGADFAARRISRYVARHRH